MPVKQKETKKDSKTVVTKKSSTKAANTKKSATKKEALPKAVVAPKAEKKEKAKKATTASKASVKKKTSTVKKADKTSSVKSSTQGKKISPKKETIAKKEPATKKKATTTTTKKETVAKKEPATKKKAVTTKKETVAKKEPATKKKAVTTKKETAAKKEPATKKKAVTTKKETVAKKEPAAKKKAATTKKKTTTTKKAKVTKKASVARKRKTTKKESTTESTIDHNPTVEYYDLPNRYNQTMVKVLFQTPKKLFVYWEISDADRERLLNEHGSNFFEHSTPFLIIHNITKNYSFRVEINDFANSWYFDVPDSNCEYYVDLIRVHHTTQQPIQIQSSNGLEVPNNHILFEQNRYEIFFKNVKTDVVTSKKFAKLQFISHLGIVRPITLNEFYNKFYNEKDLYATNNPSSY